MKRSLLPLAAALLGAAVPAAAAPPRKPAVAVFGDRFGTALAAALADTDPNVAVVTATSDDAGLAGPGFAGWLRALKERLARPDRPDAAVMMVGEADGAPLVEGPARLDPAAAGWPAAYGARVDAVARLFAEARVPLVWVGLPPVRNPDASAIHSRIDGILRDRAGRDGARYVDVWGGFTDAAGRFSAAGPDADGRAARLRRGDGFTSAGARKLASFAIPEVARAVARGGGAGSDLASLTIERARDFDGALSVDVNAQIRREAAREGLPEAGPRGPQGAAAGPVVPLTSPPAPAGVELATPPAPGALQASLAPAPDAPKPGRADDFTWPRPSSAGP